MHNRRYFRVTALTVFLIIILGFLVARFIGRYIDNSQRAELLEEASQAALLVPADVISGLSASPLDLESILYKRLKADLAAFRAFDPSIRFVYVLGYRPEIKTQFFYVDSEPVGAVDYSPPGQLFTDTREKDIANYLNGEAYTDGPYQDSWGEWVSGYAPIRNASGEMIALLGIDMETSVYHHQIRFVNIVISLITLLLSILAAIFIRFIQQKETSIASLEKEKQSFLRGEKKMKEVQDMAHLGKIVGYFPEETFSFDETFAKFFSAKENEKISKSTVLAHIHPDDQTKFNKMVAEILSADIAYTWVDVRIGSPDKGYRLCHIYGSVFHNDSLAPNRFSGIIQDITDISHR